MTTAIGLLGAIFTIAAAGFGCAVLLARRRLTLSESCALPWLLGSTIVSLGLWICGLLLRGFVLQMVVSALCISLGAVGVVRSRKFPKSGAVSRREMSDWICGIVFAAELAIIVCISFQHTLGWDGLTVWEIKARHAFQNGGVLPSNYYSDPALWFSHSTYPLLLPLTQTWLYLWIGEANQFLVKLLFPLWYIAAMSMLLLAATELSGKRLTGWIIVLLFPLVPAIYCAPGGIEVGYADLPLAAIYVAAILYLLRFMREGRQDTLALFIALAATLPWMKREGAVLWLAVSICGAFLIVRRRNWFTALLSFAPGLVIIFGWKLFVIAHHAVPSPDFTAISAVTFLTNWPRITAIGHELIIAMRDPTLWGAFWLLVLIALVCVLVRERTSRAAAVLWLFLMPLSCYCATYIFSAWSDLIAHIDTSLPRLLIQLTPVAWLVIALALRSRATQPAPLEPQPTARSGPGTDYS